MGLLSAEKMAEIENLTPSGEASQAAPPAAVPEAKDPPVTEGSEPPAPAAATAREEIVRLKVNGQEMEVPVYGEDGKINPILRDSAQFREAFYRGSQQWAEERKALTSQVEELGRKIREAEAQKEEFPELPDDDPYGKGIKLMRQQVLALKEEIARSRQAEKDRIAGLEQEKAATAAQGAKVALEAKERELSEKYKLDADAMEVVELKWLARVSKGERVSIDEVAKGYSEYLAGHRTAGKQEFKDKTRVGRGATERPGSTPVSGAPVTRPTLRSGGIRDMVEETLRSGKL